MYKIKKDLKDKIKLLKISTKDCKAHLKFDDLYSTDKVYFTTTTLPTTIFYYQNPPHHLFLPQ